MLRYICVLTLNKELIKKNIPIILIPSSLRLTHSIVQSKFYPFHSNNCNITFFFISFKTRKKRKTIKYFIDCCCKIYICLSKKFYYQHMQCIGSYGWIIRTSILLLVLIKAEGISKTRMKSHAEIWAFLT